VLLLGLLVFCFFCQVQKELFSENLLGKVCCSFDGIEIACGACQVVWFWVVLGKFARKKKKRTGLDLS
jgi:hypothetical protein